jgi:hypothetical protein
MRSLAKWMEIELLEALMVNKSMWELMMLEIQLVTEK